MPLLKTIKFITSHPLNKKHKLRSIIRFVKWQVGSRLVPGAIVYDWINGSKFLVKTGEAGLTGNIYAGLDEFPDMIFVLHFLRADDLFVDVGANVGSYTILACSVAGAQGIAFEPIPSTYKRLVENMRLNHLDDKVKCINKGVAARQENIRFNYDSGTTNHAVAFGEQCERTVTVGVTSLDATLPGESPMLMKIDVEGYETPVLEGAKETLKNKKLHSVIVELNGSGRRYGFDESRILELMFDYGFRTYSYDPVDRMLINLEGKNLYSGNTLFIRNEAFVIERLKNSAKVNIHGYEF